MARDRNEDELISTGRKRKKRIKEVPTDGVKVDLRVKERQRNGYYMSVAGKYRAARYLTVVFLVAFLLVMLVFFRENITYSNLMYLVRDLDADVGPTVGAYANVTYDSQYAEEFAMFKGRIAVAGTTGLTLFDASGSKEAEYDCSYTEPGLVTGDKYALMYDAGDRGYSVYTSVARVLFTNADDIIEDAAVSDSGYYALLTRSEESKFLVTVYNGSFKPVTKYFRDKYVIDISLDPEGKEAAIVSASSDNSGIACEVSLCTVGTENTVTLSYGGIMPVSAEYADDGTLFVMCDTCLMAFRDGDLSWRHDFTGMNPGSFCTEGNIAAVSCSMNAIGSVNCLMVFDTDGNVKINATLNSKVSSVTTDAKTAVFTAGGGTANRIDLKDGNVTSEEISVIPVKLLSPEGSLVVCGEGGTASYFTD